MNRRHPQPDERDTYQCQGCQCRVVEDDMVTERHCFDCFRARRRALPRRRAELDAMRTARLQAEHRANCSAYWDGMEVDGIDRTLSGFGLAILAAAAWWGLAGFPGVVS